MVYFKKPARKLSLRKRFLALTSNEAVYIRSLDKRLLKLMTGLKQLRLSKQCKSEGISLAKAIAEEIINNMIQPAIQLPSIPSLRNTIDSFSDSECWNFFETRKEDLHRLKVNLEFEDKCILENGSVMSGEEVLLRGFYELVSGADQHEITAIFGKDQPLQSRAFKYFINHIYDNFLHLVTDNLHLKSSWRRGGVADWQKAENKAYTKVRISIEWNYGATGNLYGYLSNHSKLKLLSSNVVSKIYTVATILRNCHVALYGCETSNYFNIYMPPQFLEL